MHFRILIYIFVFGLSPMLLSAQYNISGKVISEADEEALIGVSIQLIDTEFGDVSDDNGFFHISNVHSGQYRISFAYMGYITLTKEVIIDERNSEFLEIKMQADGILMDVIEITGISEGQLKAFMDMKNSETIKNIVAAEQIKTFPDVNAAEVMQRIPGITIQRDQGEGKYVQLRGTPPELTNFNINGEQIPSPTGNYRYVGMDIIPSDQIEFIEVSKVMTPDMDGDGIGGSVNIKTKSATKKEPELGATIASGYTHLRQKPMFNLQASYGQLINRLGIQFNVSYYQNNQGADNIEYKFAKGPFFGSQGEGIDNYNLFYREVQLRHYDIQRSRTSFSPTIEYHLGKKSKLYARGMYNLFQDDETRRRLIYDLEDPLNADYFLYGGINHDIKSRIKTQSLNTLSVGGEHVLGRFNLDYQIFYSKASEEEPDHLEASFENPGQAIAIDFDRTNADYPRVNFPNEDNAIHVKDYGNYSLDAMLLEQYKTNEVLKTPRINLLWNYLKGKDKTGSLKIGGKIRSRVKTRDTKSQFFGAYRETSTLYPGKGDPLNLISIGDDFAENNLLNKGYALSHMPSTEKIRDFYEYFPQFFVIDRNESRKNSYNEDYAYKENIYATYLMINHKFGKLSTISGLRYEKTEITQNRGYGVELDGTKFIGIDTINSTRAIDMWLPQIQFKYEISKQINLRTALTYTYSRPNYTDLIPSRVEDRKEVSVGNPNLNFAKSTNLDLLIERYFKRSIVSAGIFYKEIDDFIFSYKRFGREGAPGSGNYPVFELTKAVNGSNASVFGTEFQSQFRFDFLKGFLGKLGSFITYTYTHSRAFIPKRIPANYADAIILDPLSDDLSQFFNETEKEKIVLPGQANHNANFSLFYDDKKFFVRLSANYQDDFLIEIGPDPDFDTYYDASLRWDLSASIKINTNWNFFADVINLTNAPLRYYMGDQNTIKKSEYYSWWTRLGLRYNF